LPRFCHDENGGLERFPAVEGFVHERGCRDTSHLSRCRGRKNTRVAISTIEGEHGRASILVDVDRATVELLQPVTKLRVLCRRRACQTKRAQKPGSADGDCLSARDPAWTRVLRTGHGIFCPSQDRITFCDGIM